MARNIQNQTDPNSLQGITKSNKGTGIFAIPDMNNRDPNAVEVLYIEDITYEECVIKGTSTIAFKWIPDWWDKIKKLPCEGQYCVQTCPPLSGCLCINGICQKPKSTP